MAELAPSDAKTEVAPSSAAGLVPDTTTMLETNNASNELESYEDINAKEKKEDALEDLTHQLEGAPAETEAALSPQPLVPPATKTEVDAEHVYIGG